MRAGFAGRRHPPAGSGEPIVAPTLQCGQAIRRTGPRRFVFAYQEGCSTGWNYLQGKTDVWAQVLGTAARPADLDTDQGTDHRSVEER